MNNLVRSADGTRTLLATENDTIERLSGYFDDRTEQTIIRYSSPS